MQEEPTDEIKDQPGSVSNDPLIGTRIDGRFEIISFVGEGASGRVYKARHLMLDQFVALKILESEPDENSQQRFRKEASALSGLNHLNIVKFHAFGFTANGSPYIATEFLQGKTLQELLKEKARLNAEEAVPIFIDICRGLEAAHQQGIVHRDIKPGNIALQEQSSGGKIAKILDFGIVFSQESKSQKLTATGLLIGSSNYMSPEQCMGSRDLDARSDIYSLGCLMYECLVGTPPMQADTDLLIMHNHLNKPVEKAPIANEDLKKVILRCLDKDKSKRYSSSADLEKALSAADLNSDRPPVKSGIKIPLAIGLALLILLISTFAALQYKESIHKEVEASTARMPDLKTSDLKTIKSWISKNIMIASPLDLGNAFVEGQVKHLTLPVPGQAANTEQINRINRRLKDYLLEHHSEKERLRANFLYAQVQMAAGNKPGADSALSEIKKKVLDKRSRDDDLHALYLSLAELARLRADYTTAINYARFGAEMMLLKSNYPQYFLDMHQVIECSVDQGENTFAEKMAHEVLEKIRDCAKQGIVLPLTYLPTTFTMIQSFCKPADMLFCAEHYFGAPLEKLRITNSGEISDWATKFDDPAGGEKMLLQSKVKLAQIYRLAGDLPKCKRILQSVEDPIIAEHSKPSRPELSPSQVTNSLVTEYLKQNADKELDSFLKRAHSKLPTQTYLELLSDCLTISLGRQRIPAFLLEQARAQVKLYEKSYPIDCAHINGALANFAVIDDDKQKALTLYKESCYALCANSKSPDEILASANSLIRMAMICSDLNLAEKTIIQVITAKLPDNTGFDPSRGFLIFRGRYYYEKGKRSDGIDAHLQITREFEVTNLSRTQEGRLQKLKMVVDFDR